MSDLPVKPAEKLSGLEVHQAQMPLWASKETVWLIKPFRKQQGRIARPMPVNAWKQVPLALALVEVLKDKNAQRH